MTAPANMVDQIDQTPATETPWERYWDDASVGDEAESPPVTVTEAMIMAYAQLTGDFTPVHVDEAYAKTTPFGTRVAHGLLGLSLADGLKTQADYRFLPGMSLGWTWDFALPIKIGDTLRVKFRVGSMRATKRPGWGIVTLPSELINQRGEVVQKGEHRLMIPRRPESILQIRSPSMPTQPLPLAGIRVIDYSHFLAGPFLSRCLAAMGAEVIKVERPTAGDAGRAHPYFIEGQSGYFLQQNMGKQGLCVNLKDPRGLEMLHKLVATADVFVENYRPGALDRLGLGYEQLAAINPRLVYCSVSAYGHTGPDAAQAGFGLIAEAKSGAMAMIGQPGEAPPLFRIALADMYTGIHGVAAVCAALLGRVGSGRGQHIDMALYDCMVSMHEYAVQCYTLSGGKEIPVQTGHDLPQSTVYGVFSARDGHFVIAAQVDDAWLRLAKLIGGDELAADQRFHHPAGRNEHREEILAKIRAWAQALPSVAACIAALESAAVSCAPVQRIDQVLTDPQVQARGMIVEQDHPVLGRIRLPNLPFRFSECDTSPKCVAPLMGQHNREIAAALGYAPAQIDALVNDGVLYAEAAVGRL